MLRPKRGYENSEISFRVGAATLTIKVSDITEELIHKYRHHLDLSEYVEKVEPIEYDPEQHDAESIIQQYVELQTVEKPKKTRKKKNG